MHKTYTYIILILLPALAPAQEDILEQYIQQGLESNLALQQKENNYYKQLFALQEARGMFYPKLGFYARYSVAEGGRTIDLPIGDMMNPVYGTLNEITTSLYNLGLSDQVFPTEELENEEIRFLRPTEHDTKLRLVQPVFNTDIYFNAKINKNLLAIKKADVNMYKRSLVAEIKTAYFNYLKTLEYNELLIKTRELLMENIRVSKRLHDNDKVTIDAVYRSEA